VHWVRTIHIMRIGHGVILRKVSPIGHSKLGSHGCESSGEEKQIIRIVNMRTSVVVMDSGHRVRRGSTLAGFFKIISTKLFHFNLVIA
jgi:hypothetical protein